MALQKGDVVTINLQENNLHTFNGKMGEITEVNFSPSGIGVYSVKVDSRLKGSRYLVYSDNSLTKVQMPQGTKVILADDRQGEISYCKAAEEFNRVCVIVEEEHEHYKYTDLEKVS